MIASISFVKIDPLVFEFWDELTATLRLVDAVYALHAEYAERPKICSGGWGTWATIPSPWIAWSDWEKRLCQSRSRNEPVLMDNPAVFFPYFEEMVIECSWEMNYSSAPPLPRSSSEVL